LPYYEIIAKLYIDHVCYLKDQQHQGHHEPSKEEEEHCQIDLYLNMLKHFHLVHIKPLESHLNLKLYIRILL
jgi:hypothetical protein